jgi:hypothetical protein
MPFPPEKAPVWPVWQSPLSLTICPRHPRCDFFPRQMSEYPTFLSGKVQGRRPASRRGTQPARRRFWGAAECLGGRGTKGLIKKCGRSGKGGETGPALAFRPGKGGKPGHLCLVIRLYASFFQKFTMFDSCELFWQIFFWRLQPSSFHQVKATQKGLQTAIPSVSLRRHLVSTDSLVLTHRPGR